MSSFSRLRIAPRRRVEARLLHSQGQKRSDRNGAPAEGVIASPSLGRRKPDAAPRLEHAPLPEWVKGGRNKYAARFILHSLWVDSCLGVTPGPDRWPYSDFNRAAVEKLLAWAQFSPVASAIAGA